jgi:ribosome biogenesis protein Nip4
MMVMSLGETSRNNILVVSQNEINFVYKTQYISHYQEYRMKVTEEYSVLVQNILSFI